MALKSIYLEVYCFVSFDKFSVPFFKTFLSSRKFSCHSPSTASSNYLSSGSIVFFFFLAIAYKWNPITYSLAVWSLCVGFIHVISVAHSINWE